ncbi:hypothetical protein [Enterobacter sp. SA187]|uniref:hypothetical protein n=1 Tax=Enterobacter sp. SA187 TaxID=1914861 RepID=UPI0009335AAB|nr:hypothetical protein [Enterobacter sp. SA187]
MDDDEIKIFMIKSGVKKREAAFLIKLAKRKKISIGRAFFLYVWKYYAWSGVLLLSVIFGSIAGGVESFLVNFLFCSVIAFLSLFFTPFFMNLVWSIKIQVKLIGK